MARVIITVALREEILRTFKAESVQVFKRLEKLEGNPKQGKTLGHVGSTIIKELKRGTHRFYFITDGHVLKFGSKEDLARMLIKFVRMSEKKDQQKTIDEIREILTSMGFEGF